MHQCDLRSLAVLRKMESGLLQIFPDWVAFRSVFCAHVFLGFLLFFQCLFECFSFTKEVSLFVMSLTGEKYIRYSIRLNYHPTVSELCKSHSLAVELD